jgi:hypothetical protein
VSTVILALSNSIQRVSDVIQRMSTFIQRVSNSIQRLSSVIQRLSNSIQRVSMSVQRVLHAKNIQQYFNLLINVVDLRQFACHNPSLNPSPNGAGLSLPPIRGRLDGGYKS